MIIRNVSLNWEAMKVLDFSWLKAQYTKTEDVLQYEADNCYFKCYKTNEFPDLGSVFAMSEQRVSDVMSSPWYVGWSVCHPPVLKEIEKLGRSEHSVYTSHRAFTQIVSDQGLMLLCNVTFSGGPAIPLLAGADGQRVDICGQSWLRGPPTP